MMFFQAFDSLVAMPPLKHLADVVQGPQWHRQQVDLHLVQDINLNKTCFMTEIRRN